jgi:hypothetical protein
LMKTMSFIFLPIYDKSEIETMTTQVLRELAEEIIGK